MTRGWHYKVDLPIGLIDAWWETRDLYATEDRDFGKYNTLTRDLDQVLYDHPSLLSIWAAGNDRDDQFSNLHGDNTYWTYISGQGWCQVSTDVYPAPPGDGNAETGYDSLPPGQNAKNSLVVGAINDITADPYDTSQVVMSSFSDWGPTDDGRIKPDVVGDGVALVSPISTSDTAYDISSGTSMAAPNVTGTAALLYEYWKKLYGGTPRSATMKDLLIHTAFDAGNEGPDYIYGWGVVDGAAAAQFLTKASGTSPSSLLLQNTYTGTEWVREIVSDGTSPLKATIAWTDPPGSPHGNGLDETTPVLVNDLDFWIVGPDNTIYYPWTLDPANPSSPAIQTQKNHLDNVEQVLIDQPTAGTYQIHVGHTGAIANGTQDYSLLVSGTVGSTSPPPAGGRVRTQADFIHEADRVRATLPPGLDGSGLRIGVISDSFNISGNGSAQQDIASGDLPAEGVTVLKEGTAANGSDEGRAMLQIIHDIAPGATLLFASYGSSSQDFADSIRALADPARGNADIIVDDGFFTDEPFFQDGIIAQAIDEVVTNYNVAYFALAGNLGTQAYESENFAAATDPIDSVITYIYQQIGRDPGIGQYHDFDPGSGIDTRQRISIGPRQELQLILQWDDPFYTNGSGVDTDLDIFMFTADQAENLSLATGSIITSQETGNPWEGFTYFNNSDEPVEADLLIRWTHGSQPGRIKYVNYASNKNLPITFKEYATNSPTVIPHAAAVNARGVGAVDFFDQNNPSGTWRGSASSSPGPYTVLFNPDGSRKPTPEVRLTPAFAAITGGDTTFFPPGGDADGNGYPNFFGTSAAAPAAAAIAALVKQAHPEFTPQQIYERLESTAQDIYQPGFDRVTGYGLIDAYRAVFGNSLPASVPFTDNFESGALFLAYETKTSGAGRIQVTGDDSPLGNYHLRLGLALDAFIVPVTLPALNEVILHLNAQSLDDVELSFDQKEFGDSDEPMPQTFAGSNNSDGVALSVDGQNWFRLVDLTGSNSTNTYQRKTINLSDFANNSSLVLGSDVRIKFQQFSPNLGLGDGFAFDNISVTGLPSANLPTANNDSYTLDEDTILSVAAQEGVLANDSDPNSDPLTALRESDPSNGTLILNPDGSFNYIPKPNFSGVDSFTYRVSDGKDGLTSAKVTLTIKPIQDSPQASNNTLTTNEDIDLIFAAPNFNFSDADPGDSLQAVRLDSLPANGILYLDLNGNQTVDGAEAISQGGSVTRSALNAGQFKFKPNSEQNGSPYTSFNFSVSDGQTFSPEPVTMTLNVNAVNDAPKFTLTTTELAIDEDAGGQTVPGFVQDIAPGGGADEAGQALTFNLTVANTTGNLTFTRAPAIDPATGTLTYEVAPNANGTATIRATLQDNGNTSNDGINVSAPQTFTLTVNSVNDAPINTVPQQVQEVDEDTILTFGNLIRIADVDLNPGVARVTLSVNQGTLTLSRTTGLTFTTGDGEGDPILGFTGSANDINAALNGLKYQGILDFFGSDTLTITTDDQGNAGAGGILSDTDTVEIVVKPVEEKLSIDDITVIEGNSGITLARFTVSLNNPSSKTVTVDYTTLDGTAQAGSDYNSTSGTLTLTPGTTTNTIDVAIIGDRQVEEPEETFLVNLSNLVPTDITMADSEGKGTIIDVEKGDNWGDPHLITFDRLAYDFQAVGEFVLVESQTDDWTIQVRLEPWGDSQFVSANTAVATLVDGVRVGLYRQLAEPLLINDEPTPLADGSSLTLGNSLISRSGDTYTITYAGQDGIVTDEDDQLIVKRNADHLNIEVFPSSDRINSIQGLLGNANGKPSDDWALRNGVKLSQSLTFKQFYEKYAESWRISQAESLFTYSDGTDTNTFTNRNLPSQPACINLLDPALRATAEQMAREAGVPEGARRNAAILDYAITGNPTFFEGAATAQEASQSLQCLPEAPLGTGGFSWGDPHEVTFDGYRYDLQAAGEFTLVKSASGDLNIQVRQEPVTVPWGGKWVSVNTAAATLVDGRRVGLYVNEPIPLKIDGVATDLANGTSLTLGAGRIERHQDRYTIIYPSGDRLDVGLYAHSVIGKYLNTRIYLADGREGEIAGLLGNNNGDSSDDLTLPDGTVLTQPLSFEQLYGQFANAWRITQAESLFHYNPGEGTNTFTDPSFPSQFITIEDLPADKRALAEQIVQELGITDPTLLANAILDIALTDGDPAFIDGAADQNRLSIASTPTTLIGPSGFGAKGWVAPNEVLTYQIRFENPGNAATPVAAATITQQLDPDLDWTTLELGDLSLGIVLIDVPDGRQTYSDRLDLSNSLGIFVDVSSKLDPTTGQLSWTLQAIDPATGQPPTNSNLGFLPPNNANNDGVGYISYRIQPQDGRTTNTQLTAQATITFNGGNPTNTLVYLNTLDVGAPSSSVTALPANSNPNFTLSWSGSDDGSGIADYDIYASVDGSPFSLWLDDTTATSATYAGQAGKTYAFYSVARDNVGHIEAAPNAADTQTSVIAAANNPPTLSNISKSGDEDTAIAFSLADFTAAFSDPDSNSLTRIQITTLPSNGVLKLNGVAVGENQEIDAANLGNLTFELNANFNGNASFNWNGFDGTTYAANPAQVNLTVNPVNDAPVVQNAIPDQTFNEDTPVSFTIPANTFSDVDNPTLNYTATLADDNALPGWLSLTGGTFSGTPSNEDVGSITIQITAKDSAGASASTSFRLAIANTNDAPTAVDDGGTGFTADEDNPVTTANVLSNDGDVDIGDVVRIVSIDTTGTIGLVINNNDGTFTYNPNGKFEALNVGQSATDSFTYTISDEDGGTSTAKVTVTINGVNEGLIFSNNILSFTLGGRPQTLTATLDYGNDGSIEYSEQLAKNNGGGFFIDSGDSLLNGPVNGTNNPDLLDITPIGYNNDPRSALRPASNIAGLAVDTNGPGDEGASSGARNFSAGEKLRFDLGVLQNMQLFGNRAEIAFGQFDRTTDTNDLDIEVKLYKESNLLEKLSFDLGFSTTVTATDDLFGAFDALYHVRLNSYDKIKVGSGKIRFDIVSDLPDMILEVKFLSQVSGQDKQIALTDLNLNLL
jgi:VCBS repeat-containing protein